MAVLTVFIPVLMLGVVLALGRYEELLLPDGHDHSPDLARPGPGGEPADARPLGSGATLRPTPDAATPHITAPAAAGTPAPSP